MAKSPATAARIQLDTSAVRALFEGLADAWIVGLCSFERPPRGLAGMLDWHLGGWLSQSIRSGIFQGNTGECAYLPHTHQGRTLHLLFVGLGTGKRKRGLPASSLGALKENLKGLGRTGWGVSVSDFNEESIDSIAAQVAHPEKGGTLWISP